MRNLEDSLPDLRLLDEIRTEVHELRANGLKALTHPPDYPGWARHVWAEAAEAEKGSHHLWTPPGRAAQWKGPGDRVEAALMLRAFQLSTPASQGKSLERTELATMLSHSSDVTWSMPPPPEPRPGDWLSPPKDTVRFLRIACSVRALANEPGFALTWPVFNQCLLLLDELYGTDCRLDADAPTRRPWAGARAMYTSTERDERQRLAVAPRASAVDADPDAPKTAELREPCPPTTAYMTSECVRGILSVVRTMRATAEVLERPSAPTPPSPESDGDKPEEVETSESKASGGDGAHKSSAASDPVQSDRRVWACRNFVDGLAEKLREDAAANLPWRLERARIVESDEVTTAMRCTGHVEDFNGIERGKIGRYRHRYTERIRATLERLLGSGKQQKEYAGGLREAALRLITAIGPVEDYASSIIDRELTASEIHPHHECDAPELAFAVATYLAIRGERSGDDAPRERRVIKAAGLLRDLVQANGALHSGSPFVVDDKGRRIHVATTETVRALAFVFERVKLDVDPVLARTLLSIVKTTYVSPGWRPDWPKDDSMSTFWASALAADALDRLERMLNRQINEQIYPQFSVKRPSPLRDSLDDVYYPDAALVALGMAPETAETPLADGKGVDPWRPELLSTSLGIVLQRLRRHAVGCKANDKPLFSLVLYGPPGTGKTTLAEAVAQSANVPLIEVTPSDLLVGGEGEVERRARAVFEALSMLTHTVVLFDEFDEVLRDRKSTNGSQRDVFSFLTPGMLPKLKSLHTNSERHSVCYILATNHIETLDPAVVREGRFDLRLGVYPPDVLTRAAWLVAFCGNPESVSTRALENTAGAGIAAIAKGLKKNCCVPLRARPCAQCGFSNPLGREEAPPTSLLSHHFEHSYVPRWLRLTRRGPDSSSGTGRGDVRAVGGQGQELESRKESEILDWLRGRWVCEVDQYRAKQPVAAVVRTTVSELRKHAEGWAQDKVKQLGEPGSRAYKSFLRNG